MCLPCTTEMTRSSKHGQLAMADGNSGIYYGREEGGSWLESNRPPTMQKLLYSRFLCQVVSRTGVLFPATGTSLRIVC